MRRDRLERCVLLPFSLGCMSESSVVVRSPHCHNKRSSSEPQHYSSYHIATRTRNKEGREKDDENEEEEDEDEQSVPRFQRLLKNFKNFSHLLLYKEEDDEIGDEMSIMGGGEGMEIGFPTDVKHVTHIGLDGAATSIISPSWRPPTANLDLFNHQNLLGSGNAPPLPLPPAIATVAPGGTPP